VAIENILIELKTPTWFPSAWFLEKLAPQKYIKLTFEPKIGHFFNLLPSFIQMH